MTNPIDNNNQQRQPDIEVYIKDITIDDILGWLDTVFDDVVPQGALDKPSMTVHCRHHHRSIPLTIYTGAAGKKYTSLWFQSAQTPWATDLDCAQQLVETLGHEVRCSTGEWKESDDTDNQWWKVTRKGKTVVSW